MTQEIESICGKGRGMPNLITGAKLREAVEVGSFIQGGVFGGVEGVKYDFHMGSQLLKASYKQPIDMDKLPETERSSLAVDPGEVVFVATRERIALPGNMMAVLVPKRKIAHNGIIVLGGFSVDPHYSGPLWVGLYNYASVAFPLKAGRKLIAAMFYELEGDEVQDFPMPESSSDGDFPSELAFLIKNYKPNEFNALSASFLEFQKQLDALAVEVREDRSWRRDIQDALERQSRSLDRQTGEIDKLLEGLKEERETRKQEDSSIRTRLDGMTTMFAGMNVSKILIGSIIVAALGGLAGHYVPKMLSGIEITLTHPQPAQSAPLPPAVTPGKTQP